MRAHMPICSLAELAERVAGLEMERSTLADQLAAAEAERRAAVSAAAAAAAEAEHANRLNQLLQARPPPLQIPMPVILWPHWALPVGPPL